MTENNLNRFKIGGIPISITSSRDVIESIKKVVGTGNSIHICVCDFRSVCYASKHADYKKILQTSHLNTPDGMPLIWMGRLWGIKNVHRTMGPHLFVKMLKDSNSGIKHFLLGDTDDILHEIKSKFKKENNALIVGTFSPPFININEYDYFSIANMINNSGADIVWISMTAPKQDYFAVNLKPFLDKKVLIGVGAAFRYSLGLYEIPNDFFQKIGLTGFFMRKKTWWQFKWYLIHIFKLLYFSIQIVYRRVIGRKYYE
ncbi:WecB/TagA/CpsF family glycosyltransferase [Petrimonas sp.]|uniref:WecB/TagA/CpsF family glycosyltransferase n=1 Tax=Petrimonas sp. TaxID=2023866 RepID=UPI002FCAB57D